MSGDRSRRMPSEGGEMIDWDHHTWREHFFQMRDQVKPIVDAAMAISPERMLQAADAMTHLGEPGVGTALIVLAEACRRAREGKGE